MRAEEFLSPAENLLEAEKGTERSKEIYNAFEKAGYKLLGYGVDATVWAKDDSPDVIKIIMPEDGEGAGPQAKTFYKFYQFCQDHPDLENLPKFTDLGKGKHIETIEIDGVEYMAIGMEKLKPIDGGSFEEALVWNLSDYATKKMSWDEVWEKLNDPKAWMAYSGILDPEEIVKDLWYLDEKEKLQYEILFKLMTLLYHTGNINKTGWDLHTENAMMRGDTIVITDPWFNFEASH